MNRYHILLLLGIIFFISVICSVPAWAYLDPGTGSMIVQTVIAVIAAVSVSIGIFWQRLKSFLGKKKKDGPGDK